MDQPSAGDFFFLVLFCVCFFVNISYCAMLVVLVVRERRSVFVLLFTIFAVIRWFPV